MKKLENGIKIVSVNIVCQKCGHEALLDETHTSCGYCRTQYSVKDERVTHVSDKNTGHTIKIVAGTPEELPMGYNTQLFIDGEPIKRITNIKFSVDPQSLVKVIIDVVPQEFQALFENAQFEIHPDLKEFNRSILAFCSYHGTFEPLENRKIDLEDVTQVMGDRSRYIIKLDCGCELNLKTGSQIITKIKEGV